MENRQLLVFDSGDVGKLVEYVSDVFIYTDHYKGPESGQSPGYVLSPCCLGASHLLTLLHSVGSHLGSRINDRRFYERRAYGRGSDVARGLGREMLLSIAGRDYAGMPSGYECVDYKDHLRFSGRLRRYGEPIAIADLYGARTRRPNAPSHRKTL